MTQPLQHWRRCSGPIVALVLPLLLAACGDRAPSGEPPPLSTDAPVPWQRTEEREACDSFSIVRQPFFGDLHVHTSFSVDAIVFNVLATPTDAYAFATGNPIRLAPYDANGVGTRPAQLRRPLDFTAVTDHSEGYGAYRVCFIPGNPGYDSSECQRARAASVSGDPATIRDVFLNVLAPIVVDANPRYPASICGDPPTVCTSEASVVWNDIQDVAERFYDRTADCRFTSFVGYEWTGNTAVPAREDPPLPQLLTGANLHRNVIFRNATVPDLPVSYIDQPKPQNMWRALREKCQDGRPPCDWLAIPHNANLSGGRMFLPEDATGAPLTAADAAERATNEPLVEIYQGKGSSECRTGVNTTDEQCGFELMQRVGIFQGQRDPNLTYPPSSFVRNALKTGLLQDEKLGANPFRFGLIGSTDTHNASAGATVESEFQGISGLNDDTPARRLYLGGVAPPFNTDCPPGDVRCGRSRVDDGPGGLAVVWAEENSRDALFAGMRRRETYATSGSRMVLRFFAGKFAADACESPDLAATGYRHGVPMGSEIGPFNGGQSPTFTVLAAKDAGEPALDAARPAIPGTPLQRIQIVKGWVDAGGNAQEKVFDVAGDPNNGASVDTETCTPSGRGFDILCTTWSDPEFVPGQRAFYYARVLENPTCRWSTLQCNAAGVDCSRPDEVPPELVACCEPTVPKTVQERAWASPIWYRPEGLGAVSGAITFGGRGGDVLELDVPLGTKAAYSPERDDLTVTVRDSDVVYQVTLPAGTLASGAYEDPSGRLGGVREAGFVQLDPVTSVLTLKTVPIDLGRVPRVDHMVEVELRAGTVVASQSRLWTVDGDALVTTD